jgi:hypothetical protein
LMVTRWSAIHFQSFFETPTPTSLGPLQPRA